MTKSTVKPPPHPEHPAHPPTPRGQSLTKLPPCVVCSTPADKDDESITSRLTTLGLEVVHERCVPSLPEADGQWGYHYPAGSVAAVRAEQ